MVSFPSSLSRLALLAPLVGFIGLFTAAGARANPDGPAAAQAPAGDDDFIRFTLEPPSASPYHTIRYEITRRGPATTAVHRRHLPGLDEGLHALGLLTPEEADELFAFARTLNAASLADARAPNPAPGALTWRCDLLLSGRAHTFKVHDPDNLTDRRYARLFSAVRSAVLAQAGPLPFRNVFFPAADRGWLNVESVPAAKVLIDGFDTKLTTPIYGYELGSGVHTITLTSLDGRFVRSFDFRLEPQGTTTLRIDLR